MPLHEFCNEDRKDCTEVLFMVGDEIPEEVEGKRRVVSSPVIKFRGPFSGGSTPSNVLHEFGPGQQVYEAGMDKDVKRAKKARHDKQDKERKQFIEKELSGLNL